jgi:hypothetical protein
VELGGGQRLRVLVKGPPQAGAELLRTPVVPDTSNNGHGRWRKNMLMLDAGQHQHKRTCQHHIPDHAQHWGLPTVEVPVETTKAKLVSA